MWLLETQLQDVNSYPRLENVPPRDLENDSETTEAPRVSYAILSHRWEDDDEEISFEDIMSGRPIHHKKGWFKLMQSCHQARREQINYVWIDTCCIDKRSSAELQEAINSMYSWYERAKICYVYLRDVSYTSWAERFPRSEWFTRGWTLQELLAPKKMMFFDKIWNQLGCKLTLKAHISCASGIAIDVLTGDKSTQDCSVAARMSWAAHRRTSRVEDRAYSLLGIFSINMPMLYGEGDRAFMRLQEEIVKRDEDASIFAWSSAGYSRGAGAIRTRGLLALSPDAFRGCGDILPFETSIEGNSYSVTNQGLLIHAPLIPYSLDTYFAPLDCIRKGKRVGIFLQWTRQTRTMCRFRRVAVDGDDLKLIEVLKYTVFPTRAVLIPQMELCRPYETPGIYGFRLHPDLLSSDLNGRQCFSITGTGALWDPHARTVTIPHGSKAGEIIVVGFLTIKDPGKEPFKSLALAFDARLENKPFEPLVLISEKSDLSKEKLSTDVWLEYRDMQKKRLYNRGYVRDGLWLAMEGTTTMSCYFRQWPCVFNIQRGSLQLDGVLHLCWNVSLSGSRFAAPPQAPLITAEDVTKSGAVDAGGFDIGEVEPFRRC